MSAFVLTDVCRDVGELRVLHQINIVIPERQFTAIIGPSGSGKTSLLRLLNRLDDPTSGTIAFRDRYVTDIPIRDLRKSVGFVFQTPVMFPGSVRNNLAVAAQLGNVPLSDVDARMDESLQLAELDPRTMDRDASRLSVGQQHRVSVARALMTRPQTLLLDEPTASLDPETADRLMNTISRLSQEQGVTVVAATHRLQEAKRISQCVVMLETGQLIQAGPTTEIFNASEHPRVRSFLESMS